MCALYIAIGFSSINSNLQSHSHTGI